MQLPWAVSVVAPTIVVTTSAYRRLDWRRQ
jgi:hypothetical protein